MRVLVTGSNGLLGQKLTSLLIRNPKVTLFLTGKGPCRINDFNLNYFPCDLTAEEEVQSLIEWSQPEYIIHAAAMTQVDDCELNQKACWETNVSATLFLLEAAKKYDAFFQYISTDFVFDGKEGPYKETDLPLPISHYGKSKLEAENLVRHFGVSWAIVRTVLVYGFTPHLSRSNIILWVKENLEKQTPIKVVTDQYRTPTLAEDLAEGCSLILNEKASGLFHVSGDEMMTPFEMAQQVADHFGLNQELIEPVTANTFTQPGKRPPKTGFDISKAASTLGFHPKSFQQGISLIAQQLK